MKYTTFRNTLLGGTVMALVGGGVYLGRHGSATPVASQADKAKAPVALPEPKPADPPTPVPTGDAKATQARGLAPKAAVAGAEEHGARTPLRPMDRELLRLYRQGGKPAKVKDVFPGTPQKVNLYVEGDRVVRAKVDLDRNGKWDEKWTFEQEGGADVIKRHVSPADDDTNYSLKYKLAGEEWVQK